MKRFFLNISFFHPFSCFSKVHIICMILTFFLLLIVVLNRKKISRISDKKKKFLCYFMTIVIILNLITYRGSYLILGKYEWHKHLDLYLCFIINWMLAYCWIFQNKKLYEYVYYFSFTGPLISIFFPDLKTGPDTFIFYSFFIAHNLLFIFNIMTCIMWNIKFDIKNMIYSSIVLISVLMLTYIFNFIFKTSYNNFDGLIDSNFFYYILMRIGLVNIVGNDYLLMIVIGLIGYFFAFLLLKCICFKKEAI